MNLNKLKQEINETLLNESKKSLEYHTISLGYTLIILLTSIIIIFVSDTVNTKGIESLYSSKFEMISLFHLFFIDIGVLYYITFHKLKSLYSVGGFSIFIGTIGYIYFSGLITFGGAFNIGLTALYFVYNVIGKRPRKIEGDLVDTTTIDRVQS